MLSQIIAYVAFGLFLTALCVFFASLFLMFLRWNTSARRRHAIRAAVSFLAILLIPAGFYAYVFWVFLPAIAREQMDAMQRDKEKKYAESSHVFVGDMAPEFSATTLDGQSFSISEAQGKVVLINFFATWCGPCQMELPGLKQIYATHSTDPHFRMLMIGREETELALAVFAKEHDISIPVAADPQRVIYDQFADAYIPRNIIISADGKVLFSRIGYSEEDLQEMADLIDRELAKDHGKP
ncbi:redoxin domain-containing protein [bacterium]|nr:redoxin domain-containing protein [bacterium]